MKVPFLDLSRGQASERAAIKTLLAEVVDSGKFLFGPRLAFFEQALANNLGIQADNVLGCHSGTDAILLSLLCAGVGHGDEVITVPNTAIATAAAIVASGARPVFADVNEQSELLCEKSLAAQITPRTRAVIPVHLFGNVVDIFSLRATLSRLGREDIIIIEDAAQAQGGYLGNHAVGTLGDFSAFSFFPTKNLGAMGDGGALTTRNSRSAARCRALRFYGQTDRNLADHEHGINSRLDEFQSSILSLKLESMHLEIERKTKILERYRAGLADTSLRFPLATEGAQPAWHLCVVVAPNEKDRDALRAHLASRQVDTLVHYPNPLHLQPAFRLAIPSSLPKAESLAKRILSLPFSANHTEEEIDFVIQCVNDWHQSGD